MSANHSIKLDDVAASEQESSSAWLLDLPSGHPVAVAERDIIYIFTELATIFPIPQTPAHVSGVLIWQQRLVPLIDLGVYLRGTFPPELNREYGVMVLLALPGAKLGALVLKHIPERVEVFDSQQCELPTSSSVHWDSIALSCFRHETRGEVPILNLSAVFGGI